MLASAQQHRVTGMKSKLYAVFTAAALALALPSAASAQQTPPAGYYVHQEVVYQNDGGAPDDRTYFLRLARHIGAHIAATEGDVEISVVDFAAGIKVFEQAKTHKDLAKVIDDL